MKILKKEDLTSHDVFEFMRGPLMDTHWHEDSIYLTEDALADSGLADFFYSTLTNFNYYGPNEITQENWSLIKSNINNSNGELAKQLVNEIDIWARSCFQSYPCFTVCGI